MTLVGESKAGRVSPNPNLTLTPSSGDTALRVERANPVPRAGGGMIRTLLQGRMRHPADARSPATRRALLAQQQVLERAQSPHFTRLPFVPQVQPLTLQAQRATQEDELLARFLAQAVPKKEACARHCAGCRHP